MSEPLIDLDRLVAGIRWRRRVWLPLALLGVLGGVLFSVLQPPTPTATTSILISRTDDQAADRNQLMETDVALLLTSPVADAAAARIGEPTIGSYTGTSVTPNVLRITVTAPTDDLALRRAQALADAFIAAQVKRAQDAADARANALLARQAQLQQSLEDVSNQIVTTTAAGAGVAPGSDEATRLSATLDSLYARRTGLSTQILDLGSRADDARTSSGVVSVGTQVVDPPRVVTSSPKRAGLTNVAVGLVLGLGAGLVVAAVLAVISPRPLLRREIARELGASVVIEIPGTRAGPLRRLHRGRRAHRRRRAATTLARLVRDSAESVLVLELGCPRTTAVLGVDIAEQIAPARPVRLVDDLRPPRVRLPRRDDERIRLIPLNELPAGAPAPDTTAAGEPLTLVVGSVGPGAPWTDLPHLGSDALVVVRAGRVAASALRTAAQQLAFADVRPLGVVLVNPYPRDRSDGARWHAVHTALRRGDLLGRERSNGHRAVPAGALAQPYVPSRHEADDDN